MSFFSYALAGSPNDIIVNMAPENPKPNETVNINLNSYSYNLDTVNITYSVNNKIISEGVGKKSFSLIAPEISGENIVLINIDLPDGAVELRLVVKPNNTVLLWQAIDSYVPPFYKGKAFPTPESSIKVVAMPEIIVAKSMLNPKNMTYNWKLDYTNDGGASGYGKNFFIYTNDYLDKVNNVAVNINTVDQQYGVTEDINISSADAKIVFYKKDSRFGTMWDNAITNNHIIFEDEILEAHPYFISPKQLLNPLLSWNWTLNNTPISINSIFKNTIPLKKSEGVSGKAVLQVQIENKYKIFSTATKELNLEF